MEPVRGGVRSRRRLFCYLGDRQPLLHASATTQLIVVLAILQLSLVVFLITTLRAVGVKDWQSTVLLVLVAIAFEPVAANIDEGQINLVLLALSGTWLLGWVRGD